MYLLPERAQSLVERQQIEAWRNLYLPTIERMHGGGKIAPAEPVVNVPYQIMVSRLRERTVC